MDGLEESYNNAFDLLVGNTDFDKLSEKGSFMLPVDYEDSNAVLKHFESIEDYEKCIIIRDMVKYIITTENGAVQETFTGKELYCQILDKFQIKYKVDVKEEETEQED